MTYFSFSE